MTRKIQTANLHIRLYFHLTRFTYLLFRQTRILCLILSAVKVIAKRVVKCSTKMLSTEYCFVFFHVRFRRFHIYFFHVSEDCPIFSWCDMSRARGFFSFKSFRMHSVCKNSIFIEYCCFFIGFFFLVFVLSNKRIFIGRSLYIRDAMLF